jgi:hypothetical protein
MTHRNLQPKCKPTPFVGDAEAARWVRLNYHQVTCLLIQLKQEEGFLKAKLLRASDHFPLTAEQIRPLIDKIENQLPGMAISFDPMTELEIRLLETDCYHLNQWRYWVEGWLASRYQHVDTSTIGGYIEGEKITGLFDQLSDLKRRLAG